MKYIYISQAILYFQLHQYIKIHIITCSHSANTYTAWNLQKTKPRVNNNRDIITKDVFYTLTLKYSIINQITTGSNKNKFKKNISYNSLWYKLKEFVIC